MCNATQTFLNIMFVKVKKKKGSEYLGIVRTAGITERSQRARHRTDPSHTNRIPCLVFCSSTPVFILTFELHMTPRARVCILSSKTVTKASCRPR